MPAFVWQAIWLSLLPLSTNELLTSNTASKQNEFLGEIAQRGRKSRTETAVKILPEELYITYDQYKRY